MIEWHVGWFDSDADASLGNFRLGVVRTRMPSPEPWCWSWWHPDSPIRSGHGCEKTQEEAMLAAERSARSESARMIAALTVPPEEANAPVA